jgi:hypothetical protein
MTIVGILIALIVLLCLILGLVTIPPLLATLQGCNSNFQDPKYKSVDDL